ncbi:MAG: right-handed parallel beta-helix repeat-containing protein, partial [Kibdelosporangium sp.]
LKIVNRGDIAVKASSGKLIVQGCEVWGYGEASIKALAGSQMTLVDTEAHVGRCSYVGATGSVSNCRFHDATDNALAMVDGSEVQIQDCVVAGTGLLGIRVHSSTANIRRCDISGTGDAAISVDTHSTATITDCVIHEVHTVGLQFNQANGVAENIRVSDAQSGILLTNGARPTIRKCVLDDCRDAGVLVTERAAGELVDIEVNRAGNAGVYIGSNGNPMITDCRIGHAVAAVQINGGRGRFTDLVARDSVVGIRIKERGTGEFVNAQLIDCDSGLDVGGYSTSAKIVGSKIQDIKGAGVFAGDEARITIEDCVIERTRGVGLNASGSRITVKDTKLVGNEIGGAYVHGAGSLVAERLTVLESQGYGLWAKDTAWLDITTSEFKDNEGDGILLTDKCTGRIAGCTSTGNGGRDTVPNGQVLIDEEAPKDANDKASPVQQETVAEPLRELEALIGLTPVKKQVRTQVNLIRVATQRTAAGLPAPPASRHLVFSGPPGTGKTTVARLYGRILASLGVLAKGQVIEVSRSDLVGQYLGSTALKTRAVFEKAVGGVLFIDEAFALARTFGANSDFGQEAIDELVKLMEDRRADVVVIAAGYTDEMKQFLDMNPGLKSRFSRVIEFPQYSAGELVRIFEHQVRKNHYEVDDGVLALMTTYFENEAIGSNARDARTVFEAMLERHAERLAEVDEPSREQLLWLMPADFPDDLPA